MGGLRSAQVVTASRTGRTNGTYHAAATQRERNRRTRLLIALGGLLGILGIVNIALIHTEMTRIEQSGPERLALAGGGLDHFVPSILLNLPRASQPPTIVTTVLAGDPRRSAAFIDNKRGLERWMAVAGLSLATLFI